MARMTSGGSSLALILRFVALLLITGVGLWFAYALIINGTGSGTSIFLAAIFVLIVVGINIIFLRNDLYPLRWFAPGLALMAVMVVYPVAFTGYIAFTNYGTGNLLEKSLAISQLEDRTYLPEDTQAFSWTAFRSPDGEFLLWLQQEGTSGELVGEGTTLTPEEVSAGPLDENGIPTEIPGYQRLARAQTLRFLSDLQGIAFGGEGNETFVQNLNSAAQVQQKYVYDAGQDILVDQETGTFYEAVDGSFTSADGEQLIPGFYVTVGTRNFERFFDPNNPSFRGPFIRIFLWTFAFAVLVVVSTFSLGLFLAIIFDDPTLPGRKLIQSTLLIPYALPAFISVQIWRGLLNPQFGVISNWLTRIFGDSPEWFANPWWAKAGVLLVTLWLGFPYMFLICSGALQALPSGIYEAADIDGASAWQKFTNITFPLLMVAVGPLLIASFAFNFNNFTVIDIYNEGGPPIPNSATPAGHTDILISYIFRLAFAGGRGIDYGYASAITIIIFIILAILVGIQFRYTRVWEEVSENV